MLTSLIGKAFLHMILGISFTFVFLGILVSYMYLLARDWKKPLSAKGDAGNGDAEERRDREMEKETQSLMALSEYETGVELDPGVAAAIGMAVFELLGERQGGGAKALSGRAADHWSREGRERIMAQRSLWTHRARR